MSSEPVIRCESLGKYYRIGRREAFSTVREAIADAVRLPKRIWMGTHRPRPGIWALDDVSFEIQEGDRVGIMGPNGAGKTTLLKILSRITYPTRGRAVLQGRFSSMLEVGTGFNVELTGRENIFLNGAILGMKKRDIKKKFDEIVDFAGVEKFIDTPVKRYSSGMHVRLAFSIASHLDPEILLIDEVLSVGDAEFRKKSLNKMKEVSTREGRTILFVSHMTSQISSLCNQALWLNEGRLVRQGKVDEVVQMYEAALDQDQPRPDFGGGPERPLIRLTALSLLGGDGLERATVKTGEPVDIVAGLEAAPGTAGRNVLVHLTVTDRKGVKFFSLRSDLAGDAFRLSGDRGRLVCRLPGGLPLVPGRYHVFAEVGFEGASGFRRPEPLIVSVIPPDVFDPGSRLLTSIGPMYVEQRWSLEKRA